MRTRSVLPVVAAALAAALMSGCSSMPVPRRDGDGLLILIAANPTGDSQTTEWSDIVSVDGPTRLQINTGADRFRLFFRRVAPGTYTFSSRVIRSREGEKQVDLPHIPPLEIAAGTINLCPARLTRWADEQGAPRLGVEAVTPDDQRLVTQEISDYLNFGEWIGGAFVGFGPYRPRFSMEKDSYPYEITTRPPGARVRIDGQDWGTTPLMADLAAGRHQVSLEKDGFALTRTYVTVESEGEVEVPLTPLAGPRQAGVQSGSRIVLQRFRDLSPPAGDALGPVFDDSLEVLMAAAEAGLEPVRLEIEAAAPGFTEAEHAGGDLLAVGSFILDRERLLVQAALYDVPTRMARGQTTYTGPAGLGMFAGIDALAEDLIKAAQRDLPRPGQTVLQKSDPVRSVAYDRKRSEKEIIAKRLERKNVLVLHGYMGGEFDTIDDPPAFNNDMRLQTDGPAMGVGVTWERLLKGPLSLALISNPVVSRMSDERGGNWMWEVPLYAGARYTFAGYRTDLYWGLLGEARYAGAMTVEESGVEYDYGPYLIGGLTFDTGIKLYTYERMSRPARLVNLGMMIGVLGMRATLDFAEVDKVPIALWLYGGFGGRL